ncbi:hypothetical protein NLI96_g7911 [Meripilus lineatus]|uniref:DUF6533 domain-containing protein n=1 Tax=Meripilus lineatus TaxID=2056292 RepID=A0AAD5UYA8_9APHY|nr:hypothetical protein NLI96_g7911 [Physisporinus lineatus]
MEADSLGSISVETFRWMRIETSTNVAAAALLLYDCVLTLHSEAAYIWPTRFNFVKALFFLTRYMAFADVAFVLYYQLMPNIDVDGCRMAYDISGWLILAGIVIAETILIVRTWAIWGRSLKVALILCGIGLSEAIPAIVIEEVFLRSIVFSPLSDPRTPGQVAGISF